MNDNIGICIPLQGMVLPVKSLSSRLAEKIIDNDNPSRASRSQISHLRDRGGITLLLGQRLTLPENFETI
ncbi:hypothetical protein [Phormidium tenue]|uniref:Uncharacterized protein n=1 Tax=Phormidium tenue FACHB-1050 TaxID=2692857 RepID=A0ABR8CCC7_9CYAN|nr:hypothetical protein [Phormidium tenue]MBD2317950.1 hypothetical protein [Phormidium tenue FACHB-1050]